MRLVYLEELCLVASKGTANSQVQFLPRVHRHSFVLVRSTQSVHCPLHICVRNGTEFCSKYCLQHETNKQTVNCKQDQLSMQ